MKQNSRHYEQDYKQVKTVRSSKISTANGSSPACTKITYRDRELFAPPTGSSGSRINLVIQLSRMGSRSGRPVHPVSTLAFYLAIRKPTARETTRRYKTRLPLLPGRNAPDSSTKSPETKSTSSASHIRTWTSWAILIFGHLWLSLTRVNGAPGRIRTADHLVRSQ